jgi:hypothetical protein
MAEVGTATVTKDTWTIATPADENWPAIVAALCPTTAPVVATDTTVAASTLAARRGAFLAGS